MDHRRAPHLLGFGAGDSRNSDDFARVVYQGLAEERRHHYAKNWTNIKEELIELPFRFEMIDSDTETGKYTVW